VAQEDKRLAEYLVEYMIALLPDVKEEDFKPGQHLLREAGFSLTQAHFGAYRRLTGGAVEEPRCVHGCDQGGGDDGGSRTHRLVCAAARHARRDRAGGVAKLHHRYTHVYGQ
jgi:hypothetical protein